jgi:Flp pilus assembly protein TadD
MTAYSQGNYQLALDHLTKAVMNNPKCSPTVRIAIACCCFKLQQFDRARYAVHRATAMDVSLLYELMVFALI